MGDKTLIIFDCDGTLVDTEYLSSVSYLEALHHMSDALKIYSADQIEAEFKGMKISASAKILIDRHNLDISIEDITEYYMARVKANRQQMQRSIPGTIEALEKLERNDQFDICVASNGEFQNIVDSLECAQLLKFFSEDCIFNAEMVAHPKPSPLLFEHAAKKMGYLREDNCIVIEDTGLGVQAGKAAHYTVYGSTAAFSQEHKVHGNVELKKAGADKVFDDFGEIIDDIIETESIGCGLSA